MPRNSARANSSLTLALIWGEKTQQRYHVQKTKMMGVNFKGITAEQKELKGGRHFYTAKLVALLNLWRERNRLPSVEEYEAINACVANEAETRFINAR